MNYRIEKAKSGYDTLIIDEKLIHSRFSPEKESADVKYNGNNLIALFGIGLGYNLENIIKNNPDSIIIAIEPVSDLYNQLINNENYKNNNKLLILNIINSNVIYSFIENNDFFSEGRIFTQSNPGYKNIFTEMEHEFYFIIKKSFELIMQNVLTESNFIPVWTKNFINNSSQLIKSNMVKVKDNNLSGNLAVVVCAGPTLTYDIPDLIKYRDKITIFAVDTAIKPLIKNNIIPDFIVSLDGQFYSFDDFTKFDDRFCAYIFDVVAYSPVVRFPTKNIFFTVTENIYKRSIVEDFCIEFNINPFLLNTGGTVSDYTLSLVLSLGFQKVFFSGLDLSFPDLTTHCNESPYHFRALRLSDYYNTIDNFMIKAIAGRNIKDGKSKNKKKQIMTDFVLENYSIFFSECAKIYKKTEFYNSFNEGLDIDHIKNIKFTELMSNCMESRRINFTEILEESKDVILENKLPEYYNKRINGLYKASLYFTEVLDNTDFNIENEELIDTLEKYYTSLRTEFPYLEKFNIMTKLILAKKNIFSDSIIFHKHYIFRMIQSIYYIIRVMQKAVKIHK